MTSLLHKKTSHLLVIDIQQNLLPLIPTINTVQSTCLRLLQIAQQLHVSKTLSEHYVKGLGPTPPILREHFEAKDTFEKVHFSCVADQALNHRFISIKNQGINQIVLCGLETHVCILQTAFGLVDMGFDIFVVADATAARTEEKSRIGLARLHQKGITIVDSDMVLFEWLEQAGTADFKAALPLIKSS
ncbi:isochorismatase family protein [Kordiimonas pumila]|uniref:Isochorismatase family protein n=1 Tax=Kordiimonas pumila TaxID=2161677 RepID=A0ABV7D217_9PROT|nr:isochorismatase family protein [Kordiimonas pumila]